MLFEKGRVNGKKVVIVGGGLVGFFVVRELVWFGYDVIIFEVEK